MAQTLQPKLSPIRPGPAKNPFFQFHIDPDVNCVFVKHSNRLTIDRIYNRYEEIFADTLMRPDLNYLLDYSGSINELAPDDIRKLAHYLKAKQNILGKCKHAVLCSTIVGYGYSRMLDSLYNADQTEGVGEIKTMIYNAQKYADPEKPIREALVWLEITPDYHRPF